MRFAVNNLRESAVKNSLHLASYDSREAQTIPELGRSSLFPPEHRRRGRQLQVPLEHVDPVPPQFDQ